MLTVSKKLRITLLSVFIFLLVSAPVTYKLTNSIFGGTAVMCSNGGSCPTGFGLVLHTLVFGLITYALMFIPAFP